MKKIRQIFVIFLTSRCTVEDKEIKEVLMDMTVAGASKRVTLCSLYLGSGIHERRMLEAISHKQKTLAAQVTFIIFIAHPPFINGTKSSLHTKSRFRYARPFLMFFIIFIVSYVPTSHVLMSIN